MKRQVGSAANLVVGMLLGLSASAAGDAVPASPGKPGDALPTVLTQSGPVQGVLSADGSARVWLGLPYAAPPVGERRWKAPEPHQPWSEVLQANAFGSPCMQTGSIYGPPPPGKAWGIANEEGFGKSVGSEDCLSLNIWRPDSEERDLPVLVFIHGGSNVVGYSADPMYDGAKLAVTARAVVVTVNYRLGIFGWFLHPALQGQDALTDSGNFANLDLIQSLRFVKANAAAFGGDPGNVTVMGQSAGGINVYGLIVSPLAEGLFQKAIVMSGLIGSAAKEKDYQFANALTAQFAVQDGLAATPDAASKLLAEKGAPWVRGYLLSKTAGEILDTVRRNPSLPKPPTPFGDGAVIPADPVAAFDQGQFHRVPMIIGVTRDEAKLFTANVLRVSNAQRFTLMLQSRPDEVSTIGIGDLISPYLLPGLGSGLYDTYAAAINALLLPKVDKGISIIAKYEPKVYAYRFDWDRGPEPWKTLYGASHAIDLPFIFGNFSRNFFAMDFSERNKPGRVALSGLMMRSVGAFMRSGDPNIDGLGLTWKPWSASGDSRQKLIFDATDQAPSLSLR